MRSATAARHGLEHEREGAGGLGGVGVVQQAQRRLGGLALRAQAALGGRGLRRQPEMRDDGDARARERADAREHRAGALQLDGVGGRLLEEPPGGAQGVLVAHLVRHERQVGHDERPAAGARHRRGEHQHLVHRRGHRRGVAEHDHGRRVADQHEVDAGALGDAARRVVVGGDHHERAAVALGLRELAAGAACGRRPSRTAGWSCVLQGQVVDQARRADDGGDEQDCGVGRGRTAPRSSRRRSSR